MEDDAINRESIRDQIGAELPESSEPQDPLATESIEEQPDQKLLHQRVNRRGHNQISNN